MSVPEKHSDGRRTAVLARLVPKGGRRCHYCGGDGKLFVVSTGASWEWKACPICAGTGLVP